jgi:hypothetical protein
VPALRLISAAEVGGLRSGAGTPELRGLRSACRARDGPAHKPIGRLGGMHESVRVLLARLSGDLRLRCESRTRWRDDVKSGFARRVDTTRGFVHRLRRHRWRTPAAIGRARQVRKVSAPSGPRWNPDRPRGLVR